MQVKPKAGASIGERCWGTKGPRQSMATRAPALKRVRARRLRQRETNQSLETPNERSSRTYRQCTGVQKKSGHAFVAASSARPQLRQARQASLTYQGGGLRGKGGGAGGRGDRAQGHTHQVPRQVQTGNVLSAPLKNESSSGSGMHHKALLQAARSRQQQQLPGHYWCVFTGRSRRWAGARKPGAPRRARRRWAGRRRR